MKTNGPLIQRPPMNPETTLAFLRQTIARDFDVDPQLLKDDARLEDFAIDSLGLIEIIFAVEDQFKITVPAEPSDARTPLLTLNDLVRYLDRLVAEQHATTSEARVP